MNPFENMEKTLIVDADSIIFIACYNATKDTLPEEFYNELERESEIIRLATEYSKQHINEIMNTTGCCDVECYFTSGRDSFRYKVDPTYKANRKAVKTEIIGLSEVKEEVHKLFKGDICTEYEADDIVVLRGKQENTLVTGIDKDIINQLEGTHYNYKRNEYITTTKEEAERFVWEQMIVGDSVDGIYGISGMGKVKAKKFLEGVKDYKKAVLQLYKEKGKSATEFINNLNLLDMHLLQEDRTIRLRK